MAAADQIRRSPAKSVDGKVLPSFYSYITSRLDTLYIEVERFKERIGEKNLKGGNTTCLKRNILSRAIDNYLEDMFNDGDSEQDTISKLTDLAQLCREASLECSKHHLFTPEYNVYDSIISRVPKYIKNRLESIYQDHTGKTNMCRLSSDPDKIVVECAKNFVILTPYNVYCLGDPSKSYSNIYSYIEASDYPEVVKAYFLAQVTVFILRAEDNDFERG